MYSISLQSSEAAVTNGSILGRIGFAASNETGSDALKTAASIKAIAESTFDTTNNATSLIFSTAISSAAQERMRLTSDGKLGIGTATPSTILDVNGVITATGGNSTNWNTAYGWGDHSQAGYVTSFSETDTLASVTGRGATTTTTCVIPFLYSNQSSFPSASTYHGAIAHSHSDGAMYFAHGGSWVKLANDSSLANSSNWDTAFSWGNHASAGYLTSVTSGWTDSSSTLVIGSNAYFLYDGKLTVPSSYAELVVNEGQADFDFRVEGSGDSHLLFTDAANDRVGIGISSPTERLHVSGGDLLVDSTRPVTISTSTNMVTSKKASSGGWEFSHDALGTAGTNLGGFGWLGNNDTLTRYWIGPDYTSTDTIQLLNNGNVGIGTVSPSTRLEVVGVITATGGNSTNWNTAHGWGDHSTQGYLTSLGTALVDADFASAGIMATNGAGTYSIITDNSSNWDTAHGWGDHSGAGYLDSSDIIDEDNMASDSNTKVPTQQSVKAYVDANSGVSNLIRGSFAVTTSTSVFTVSGGYNTGSLDVYQNGVKLFKGSSYDFTETGGGTTFTLANAATNGDLIEYVALNASTNATGNTSLGSVSVTTNQTVFNTSDTFTSSNLAVFLNGVKLVDGTDYNVTSSSQFTLTSTAVSGDVVEYIAYGATVASSNLAKTGDTMTGNLTVNADLIVTGYKETHTDNGNTGTAQTIDISDSTLQTYTLTGNCTFTMPTADAGRSFTVFIKTGAGSLTATFTGAKFPDNVAPTISTTANRMDILTFYSDGTNWYGSAQQEYHV